MKHCPKCDKELSLDHFYSRKKGPRVGEHYEKCKDCMKVRGRSYYRNNRDRQLKLALIRKRKSYWTKRIAINKLKDVPCYDCGIKYPTYVMDFDHEDYKLKEGNISHMLSRSFDIIMKEILKCQVVCANCHRIRTFKQQNEIREILSGQNKKLPR